MTDDPVATVDFGTLGTSEIDLLSRVAAILRPDEGDGDGIVVSIEDGRRVWFHHHAGFTFTLVGEPATGTGRCVVPTRLFDEAEHIMNLYPSARLRLVGTTVHYGIDRHRVEFDCGDTEVERPPGPSFSTRASVSGRDLFFSLGTNSQRPIVAEHERLDRMSPVMTIVVREGEVEVRMDWSAAGCFDGASVIPAETSGPAWMVPVEIRSMVRVANLMTGLEILHDDVFGSDWLIEMNDEDDHYLRLSCGPIQLLVDRVPFGVEGAIPEIARLMRETFEVPVEVIDKTTIQFERHGESVCCEVFEGLDHRARFTIPVHTVSSGSQDPPVGIVREINAFNGSHLGAFGFVDEGVVYACQVLPLSPTTLSATLAAVEGLVHGAGHLRGCLQMAEAVGVDQ